MRAHIQVEKTWWTEQGMGFARACLPVHEDGAIDAVQE